MILLILYVVSVLISWILLFRSYLQGKKIHTFTRKEIIVGLIIVPLVPIFNIAVAIFQTI